MSHAATNWAIKQRGLKPATKIVLWHLADCHNSHTGHCYPKQSTLAHLCEMSRSTVNLHLDRLEEMGLIRRIQQVDSETKKKRPTHYVLAFDDAEKAVSENETWDDKAVSEKQAKPCPKNDDSRVRNSDIKNPVREPLKEPVNAPDGACDLFSEKKEQRKPDQTKEHFERFWAVFPKKAGKPAALKAFTKAIKKTDPEQIIAGARKYAAWLKSARPGEFRPTVKYPQGWLNDERWNDDEIQGRDRPMTYAQKLLAGTAR